MDRRQFLTRLATGSVLLAAPSRVWPFRKYFIPSWLFQNPFTIVNPPVPPTWANNGGLGVSVEASIDGFYWWTPEDVYHLKLGEYLGLMRSEYPGRLGPIVYDPIGDPLDVPVFKPITVRRDDLIAALDRFQAGIEKVLAPHGSGRVWVGKHGRIQQR